MGRSSTFVWLIVAGSLAAAISAPTLVALHSTTSTHPSSGLALSEQLQDVRGTNQESVNRDAIRPIYTPVFLSAQEADLRDWELVMGLSVNGEAKAYAVGILNLREMVNDVVGGVPVLVTW